MSHSRLNLSLVTTTLAGLALLAQTATAQQWSTSTLPPGLIAWWQAEGDMLDSVGAHSGSGSAAPTYGPGRFGQAFQFNGTDQSVAILDSYPDLDSWTQFTLEAWVNFDNTADAPGPGRCVISKVGTPQHHYEDNFGYQFGFAANATQFFCLFNTNGQTWPGFATVAHFDSPLPTSAWYHIAATYDHNAVKLYFNGVPLVTNVIGPVTIADTSSSLRLSKDDNDNVAFAGRIDDARIYNRALSSTEITRLALSLPGANGVWGLKTQDPISQAPTTLFHFDEIGANFRELGRVTLAGTDIEADGLAMSPNGGLFAFQVDAVGGSRLLALNSTSAVASVVGPVLTGRNIRGATFTLSGRLLAFDFARAELIEVNPASGVVVGAAVPLAIDLNAGTAGDLTELPDGSLVFAYSQSLYRLDPRSGTLGLMLTDNAPLADGYLPYCSGIVCVPGSDPADKLFCFETSGNDDVYQYLPSTGFARTQLYDDIVPSYNAGRGDLAALPAAHLELLGFSVTDTNGILETVCRGGLWAQVEYTDDLGLPNWQPVPGSRTLVPFTSGSIATPQAWNTLPVVASHRFFRVRVEN